MTATSDLKSPAPRGATLSKAGENQSVMASLRASSLRVIQKSKLQKIARGCSRLIGAGGESASLSLANELISNIRDLDDQSRLMFYEDLASRYSPSQSLVSSASAKWEESSKPSDLRNLLESVDPPRREILRRLNGAPGATLMMVKMREEILTLLGKREELSALEFDLENLLSAWFNPGLLFLQKLDWHSPAALLEKIMGLEAVHAISGWEDLRRRLESDRRLFAFFHPLLPDEPLIFVEVALVQKMPSSILPLLDTTTRPPDPRSFRTAVFYSISNCQPGLKGIHLGNFLIKKVASELKLEYPSLRTFCTLSPIPTLEKFIRSSSSMDPSVLGISPADAAELEQVRASLSLSPVSEFRTASTDSSLARIAAAYLLQTTPKSGDPVARFHLDNGASIERVNVRADLSEKGLRQSGGLMVNYLYNLPAVEQNCLDFHAGRVPSSRRVRSSMFPSRSALSGLTSRLLRSAHVHPQGD